MHKEKEIVILHRYPLKDIKMTNASIGYLLKPEVKAVKGFKKFNRQKPKTKFLKSLLWVLYAPLLAIKSKFTKVYYKDMGIPFPAIAYKPPDIIYCDDSFPFYAGLVKLVSPKSKVVRRLGDFHLMYYFAGTKLYKFLHWLEKKEWDFIDALFSLTDTAKEYLKQETSTKVITIPDPVNPKDFPFVKKNDDLKIVMFHGYLNKNKGVDILIKVAKELSKVAFWIVGDGPDKKRLKTIAPENVMFLGWIPFENMYKVIAQCSIGVALRNNNPGNEFLEASPFLQYSIMAKPCIVTDRKVFRDMGYPWICKDHKELAQKIIKLLDKPKEGKKWRKYVKKNHHAKKIGRKILWQLKQV